MSPMLVDLRPDADQRASAAELAQERSANAAVAGVHGVKPSAWYRRHRPTSAGRRDDCRRPGAAGARRGSSASPDLVTGTPPLRFEATMAGVMSRRRRSGRQRLPVDLRLAPQSPQHTRRYSRRWKQPRISAALRDGLPIGAGEARAAQIRLL